MPFRTLRFCSKCLMTWQSATRQTCGDCSSPLLPLLDENGALSRDFLTARGFCCDNGCRNCPYPKPATAAVAGGGSQTKACHRCGGGFECRGTDCWCHDVRLSPATLKWLERHYDDCLCPACLAEFSVS